MAELPLSALARVTVHVPDWQLGHARPHPPQLPSSVSRSTQLDPHATPPSVHPHAPAMQGTPAGQVLPQPPQLFESFFSSTQVPLQSVAPSRQLQLPPKHDAPTLHAFPQTPQFCESFVVSTHVLPPHVVRQVQVPLLHTNPGLCVSHHPSARLGLSMIPSQSSSFPLQVSWLNVQTHSPAVPASALQLQPGMQSELAAQGVVQRSYTPLPTEMQRPVGQSAPVMHVGTPPSSGTPWHSPFSHTSDAAQVSPPQHAWPTLPHDGASAPPSELGETSFVASVEAAASAEPVDEDEQPTWSGMASAPSATSSLFEEAVTGTSPTVAEDTRDRASGVN
jgi:hypothetical protein